MGIANCGLQGRVQTGTCTGGLCCAMPSSGGGGGGCATADTGDLCTDRDDCCNDSNDDIQCTTAPNRTGKHCYDCEDLAEEHCPTNPRLQCGQTIPGVGSACNNEARCPDTQLSVIPPAPTNLKPDTGEQTEGTALCNLACGDNYDCGAYTVELKRDSNIVHFDGISESGTLVDDTNSRFTYKEGWSTDGDSLARGGSGRWTQAGSAKVYFPTILKNITVYTGYDDDGGNLSAYVNGELKKTVDLDCGSGSTSGCGNHIWGKSFALNVAGTAREYVCHNSQCRLDAAKGSSNCQNDDTKIVKLSWTKVPAYNTYEIEVYPNDNRSCSDPDAICQTVYQTNYVFYPPAGTAKWAWRVRAVNDLCPGLFRGGAWSGRQTFTMNSTVTGRFYSDPTDSAAKVGGICDLTGKQALNVPADTRVRVTDLNGNNHTATITNSSYTVTVPTWTGNTASNVVTMTDPGSTSDGDYIVTCPNTSSYSGIESPQSGVNFFLKAPTAAGAAWWQAINGHLYAGSSTSPSLRSKIPTTTCIGTCIPYISRQNSANQAQSAGVIVTGGGDADSESTANTQTANTTQRAGSPTIAKGSGVSYLKEKYDNFFRLYEMPDDAATYDDFASTANDAQKPTAAPTGSKNAYYHEGDLTIQSLWNVQNSDPITEMVVFVNGNLYFDDPSSLGNLTNVQPGAFLAFIVKGDIVFRSAVGNSTLTSTASNIEGIFIADGRIISQAAGSAAGGDKRLVGEGSFVGWSGIRLNRNFASDTDITRDENNNTIPVELFSFRPDFVLNVPEKMTTTQYVWQETN